MRYGSVCSGIEAASVAWHRLGWRPQWFAEVAPFPSRVLAHRWPGVPNYGDFTGIGGGVPAIELLVGGTPCQAFSVAGLRLGLADQRGNLALEFFRLADRTRPKWILWENVAGVLSSNGGRDFGAILGALGELGYGFAYRVLDARFFGVAQSRRRVFVVGYLGDWRPPAAVLFERESLFRDPPTRTQARHQIVAAAENGAAQRRCADGGASLATPLYYSHTYMHDRVYDVDGAAQALTTTIKQNYLTPIALHLTQDPISGPISPALSAYGQLRSDPSLTTRAHRHNPREDTFIIEGDEEAVRKLTPLEYERLQGFPDHYTLIPRASDTPRYFALGNSMAVPVMHWIGQRLAWCDSLLN